MSKKSSDFSDLLSINRIHYFALFLSFILWTISCWPNSELNPEGRLTRYSDCKSFIASNIQASEPVHTSNEECLEYFYDGRGQLTMKHINAAFNCCPGTISSDIIILNGEIKIKEREASSLCDCNCLYDLDYELNHIKPGIYKIWIKGPYQPEDEPPLELVVTLKGPQSGTFCVPRKSYPWGY